MRKLVIAAIGAAAFIAASFNFNNSASARGFSVHLAGPGYHVDFGRSHAHHGGWGHWDGHHSYYGHGRRVWHDTTHYDYHPGEWVRHGHHYHYIPGHYDLH